MLFEIGEHDAGKRLDHYLQEKFPEYSRTRIQSWITVGRVRIGGARAKASRTVRTGEQFQVDPAMSPQLHAEPEDLPVEILYEDAAVVAVNKPAGLAVHAGAGVAFRNAGEPVGASFSIALTGWRRASAGDRAPVGQGNQRSFTGGADGCGAPESCGAVCGADGGEDLCGAGERRSSGGLGTNRQTHCARSDASDPNDREVQIGPHSADGV